MNSILSTHLLDKLDFHNCLLWKLNPHKVCPHTVHGLVPFFFSVVFLELLHRRDGKTLSMLPRKPNAPRNSPFVGSYRLPWQPREPLHPLWDRRHLQALPGSFPWYSGLILVLMPPSQECEQSNHAGHSDARGGIGQNKSCPSSPVQCAFLRIKV